MMNENTNLNCLLVFLSMFCFLNSLTQLPLDEIVLPVSAHTINFPSDLPPKPFRLALLWRHSLLWLCFGNCCRSGGGCGRRGGGRG